MANAPLSITLWAVREAVVRETSSMGGVAETEQTAVAVIPTGSPLNALVIIVTPEARWRITSRNAAASALASGAIGLTLAVSGCDMILLPRGCVLLPLTLIPFGSPFGKVPHAFLEFPLPRIILIPQHGQPPGIAGEITLIERLASGE